MSNYPAGVRESDLPGWFARDDLYDYYDSLDEEEKFQMWYRSKQRIIEEALSQGMSEKYIIEWLEAYTEEEEFIEIVEGWRR